MKISWKAQHFVNLNVQILWQAQHFVNLDAQISWQAQHFVNLDVQMSRQAQHFVNLHACSRDSGRAKFFNKGASEPGKASSAERRLRNDLASCWDHGRNVPPNCD